MVGIRMALVSSSVAGWCLLVSCNDVRSPRTSTTQVEAPGGVRVTEQQLMMQTTQATVTTAAVGALVDSEKPNICCRNISSGERKWVPEDQCTGGFWQVYRKGEIEYEYQCNDCKCNADCPWGMHCPDEGRSTAPGCADGCRYDTCPPSSGVYCHDSSVSAKPTYKCTEGCTTQSWGYGACPPGQVCTEEGKIGKCAKGCATSDQCKPGQYCKREDPDSRVGQCTGFVQYPKDGDCTRCETIVEQCGTGKCDVYVGEGTVTVTRGVCPEGQYCKRVASRADGGTSGKCSAGCSRTFDCAPGKVCRTPDGQIEGTCVDPTTISCDESKAGVCPEGSHCEREEGKNTAKCRLGGCTNNYDCVLAAALCMEPLNSRCNTFSRTCYLPDRIDELDEVPPEPRSALERAP
jgi:hypothetical protein